MLLWFLVPLGLSMKSSHVSGNQRGPSPLLKKGKTQRYKLTLAINCFVLLIAFQACVISYPTAGTPSLPAWVLV